MHIANLSVTDALSSLRTSNEGLSATEAQRRRQEFGANSIDEVQATPQWRQFLQGFTHFFAVILCMK